MQDLDQGSVECLSLRAAVQEMQASHAALIGNQASHLSYLQAAAASQIALLATLRGEFEDLLEDAKAKACHLARRVARVHLDRGALGDAEAVLKDALAVSPKNAALLMEAAKVSLRLGNNAACRQQVRWLPKARSG
jgi:hypothetical protein